MPGTAPPGKSRVADGVAVESITQRHRTTEPGVTATHAGYVDFFLQMNFYLISLYNNMYLECTLIVNTKER